MEFELISSVRYLGILPMFVLSLMLALKNRGKVCSSVYNRSRYMLIAATLLLASHCLIQYVCHLREQNYTLCWALNMAFYVAIAPLYNMTELNLLRAGRNMNRVYLRNGIFMIISYILLAIGYFTDTLVNNEQPYKTMTFVVALVFFCMIIELSWVLTREMRVADKRLTDEELTERHNALRYTARVMKWIILVSLLTPWVSMSPSLLLNSIFGMLMFCLILWFLLRFINYGENMAEIIEVNDEITEAQLIETETNSNNNLQEQRERIEQWVSKRRYTDPSITIAEALKEMDVSASALNNYLESCTDVAGYRKWLTYLRIEEAKRIMTEHPEYSLEHVAEACGYANGGNMSRAFKTAEGMPPSEWTALNAKK